MVQLYEYSNTYTGAGRSAIYADFWYAETFTVGSESHTVVSVKLLLIRVGSPSGNFIVGITETDANGHPKPTYLTSKTVSASSIPTTKGWVEFVMDSEITLNANTKYAIMCKCPDGDPSNYIAWYRSTSDIYSGGWFTYTYDGGSTWSDMTTYDGQFEVWGNPLLPLLKKTMGDGLTWIFV
jgi:hypothetical protein